MAWNRARTHRITRILLELLLVVGVLTVGSYCFLFPASKFLFDGRTDSYIGDGGCDPQSLASQFNVVLDAFANRPKYLLYGAVYSWQVNAPTGMPMYITWIERLFVSFFGMFVYKASPLITIVSWALVTLNGASMYLFARTLRWRIWVALAVALAWAFNPYTHARIDAHLPLAAPFLFPMIFTAMHWVHDSMRTHGNQTRSRALRIGAAMLMVFGFFAAHYYWFIALLLSPVLLLYFVMTRPEGTARTHALKWLIVCTLPAAAFLMWNLAVPAPAGLIPKGQAAISEPPSATIHYVLAARPTDFLAGDIRFGPNDWMPGRKAINQMVVLPDRMDSTESVNGIRWIILLFAALAVVALAVPALRRRMLPNQRRVLGAMTIVTVFAFLLSLRPDFIAIGGEHLNITRLSYALIPYYRCPCRGGIFAQFGTLMLAGTLVTQLLASRVIAKRKWLTQFVGVLFFSGVTLDTIPNPLIVAPLRRPRAELQLTKTYCGNGVFGPFPGPWEELTRRQELFRTTCNIVPTPASFPTDVTALTRYVKCNGLAWFVYNDPSVTQQVCASLGWDLKSPDACRSRVPIDVDAAKASCGSP
jgi:hypothetical protein